MDVVVPEAYKVGRKVSVNVSEAAEQKYDGGAGVRGYLHEAWKHFIRMHNSIDMVNIVSSARVQDPRWVLLIIVTQAYLQVPGQEAPLAPMVLPPLKCTMPNS